MARQKPHPATVFRNLFNGPVLIRGINIYDPITARLAQQCGFQVIALGGYQQGSALCVPEPTLTMTRKH